MLAYLKHQLIKKIEKIPLLQIFIYNNLRFFKFLFPHDKDYYALKILFTDKEKRAFIDVGGNIGLSAIGFRELGFINNRIYIFTFSKFDYIFCAFNIYFLIKRLWLNIISMFCSEMY